MSDYQMPLSEHLSGPHLNKHHVDGPLLTWMGEMHWLTISERLKLRFGLLDIWDIAERRWPEYMQAYRKAKLAGNAQ